jgi:phage-related protein
MVDFINGLANGIREYTYKIIDAVNNLMSAIFEAIGATVGNIPSLGANIAKGLAKGIANGVSDAVAAAKDLGNKVWSAIKKFFKINSPSKKFIEIGMGLNEGLAVGLEKYSDISTDAATDTGKSTVKAFSKAMSGITNAVSGDMDTQPTIRPVLDLSDVKSGARQIGGLHDSGSPVAVMANVGSIGSMMSRRNQNGESGEVVSAINKLRKDLANVKSETYQINGVTYDDGSGVTDAIKSIVRYAKIERRV